MMTVPVSSWRKRMGIEPTAERKSPPATGFEVRGGHQCPVRLQILIVGATSAVAHYTMFVIPGRRRGLPLRITQTSYKYFFINSSAI